MKKDSTFRIVLRVLKRRLNFRTIFILTILLAANAFAWFIYSTRVDIGMQARVRAWNILFYAGQDEISQMMRFDVGYIYPGMVTFGENIEVTNRGDMDASLSYEIIRVKILDIEYIFDNTVTTEYVRNRLANYYPFRIEIGFNDTVLLPGASSVFRMQVSWPFESGDDERDTFWGERAYEYHRNNISFSSIIIEIEVKAIQSN